MSAHLALAAHAPPAVALQFARALALASTVALVLVGLAWELWLAPTGRGTLALKVLPLLPALPGLLRHRLYTYRWLSLLVWLYVLEALWRASTGAGWTLSLALAELVLALGLFVVCGFYVRRRLGGAAAAESADRA